MFKMQRGFSRSALLITLLSAPLFAAPKTGRYALILEDPPAVKSIKSGGRRDAPEVLSARESIRQKQSALKSQLASKGFHITGSTSMLLNAVFVAANPTEVANLRAMPGVKAVFFLPKQKMNLNAAVNLLDAPNAWSALGGTTNAGAGVKIAILDTGIDQTHPAFQDPSLTAPSGFPKSDSTADMAFTSNKVIVARSYVSSDVTGFGSDPTETFPDDTSPRDRVGHGTAVAMCAGGNTNTGPLATITGLAPKAYLGNYKIYGSPGINDGAFTDAILIALDDAMTDGMDIVSLSTGGTPFSGPLDTGSFCEATFGSNQCDPEAIAIENAVENNMIVVVAAGNDGQDLGYFGTSTYVEPYSTISSPAYAPNAIAVAATGNSHIVAQGVQITGPSVPSNLTSIIALEDDGASTPTGGAFTAPLIDAASVGDIYGCSSYPANSMNGDIALIERGGPNNTPCDFSIKILNAQYAGAVGVLFYNNGQTPDIISPEDSSGSQDIPGFFIGTASGQALKTYVDSNVGVSATLNPTVSGFTDSADTNQVTYFSSHGPALGGGLKPDVAAPGENIYMATQNYDPNGEMYDPTRYTTQAGTSFSTPMVSGIAALVRQMHPAYTALQVKSAIVNTATGDTTDPYVEINSSPSSVFSVGGGKAEALFAIQSNVTVEPATLSLGQYGVSTTTISNTQTLTVTNQSSASQTLTFTVVRTNADSATQLTVNPSTLNLAAGKAGTVTVTFSGSKPVAGIYEGSVTVSGGAQSLHIPFGYTVGDGVPAQLYILAGDGDEGIVGQGTSEGFLAFGVVDQYGVPVANVSTLWTAPDGGSFLDTGSATTSYSTQTNQYGQAFATPALGTSVGTYTYHAQINGFTGYDFTDTANNQPTIEPTGVVNAASYTLGQGIAPGSYISLFGTDLALYSQSASTVPLPISLYYTSVGFQAGTVSVPGALSYASDTQINVQVPWELAGQSSVAIKVNIEPLLGQVITVPVTTYSPAIFAPANNIAAAENLSGQVLSTSLPAVQGQYVSLYCNGLGPVTNQPATGAAALADPSLSYTSAQVTATIGGQPATVQFSGLAPNFVGLYQVNVLVPTGLTPGNQPVVLTVGNVSSPSVLLPVQ